MRTFEEVQDELRECINHAYRDECEDMQEFESNVEHLDNAMQRLNELIEIYKAKNKGEWIPVSEENLPEDFQNVLVTIVRYNGEKVVRAAEYHEIPKLSRKTFRILENNERWEVGEKQLLAWMPKPEPYKGESEG